MKKKMRWIGRMLPALVVVLLTLTLLPITAHAVTQTVYSAAELASALDDENCDVIQIRASFTYTVTTRYGRIGL